MDVKFHNVYRTAIYNYIKLNSGENILYQDICEELGICRATVSRHIRWLERQHLIERRGKRISIVLF